MSQKLKNLSKLAALLLAGIALFLLSHFTTIHHSLTGTYGSGTPDARSIYVVLDADDRFTIYDQNAVRASGHCEAVARMRMYMRSWMMQVARWDMWCRRASRFFC
jgi:hypothetical protein